MRDSSRVLKLELENLPYIFLTTVYSTSDRRRVKHADCVGYLKKSLGLTDLRKE